MTDKPGLQAGEDLPVMTVTVDEAHAVLASTIPDGGVADLMRDIINTGRDARVLIDYPARPLLRQYATMGELAAAFEDRDLGRLG